MREDEQTEACECKDTHWLHMDDPFEIQRCDLCRGKEGSDAQAVLEHRRTCGCDWPEIDYRSYLWRHIGYLEPKTPRTFEIQGEMEEVLRQYDSLADLEPITKLLLLLGEYYSCMREAPDANWGDEWKAVDIVTAHVVEIHAMGLRDALPAWFDVKADEGVYDEEGRWFVNKQRMEEYQTKRRPQ